jgi:hypothetical protein
LIFVYPYTNNVSVYMYIYIYIYKSANSQCNSNIKKALLNEVPDNTYNKYDSRISELSCIINSQQSWAYIMQLFLTKGRPLS